MEAVDQEGWAIDSVVPGACKTCGWINDSLEPDARDYACEEGCGNTVDSVLVLLGVI